MTQIATSSLVQAVAAHGYMDPPSSVSKTYFCDCWRYCKERKKVGKTTYFNHAPFRRTGSMVTNLDDTLRHHGVSLHVRPANNYTAASPISFPREDGNRNAGRVDETLGSQEVYEDEMSVGAGVEDLSVGYGEVRQQRHFSCAYHIQFLYRMAFHPTARIA